MKKVEKKPHFFVKKIRHRKWDSFSRISPFALFQNGYVMGRFNGIGGQKCLIPNTHPTTFRIATASTSQQVMTILRYLIIGPG